MGLLFIVSSQLLFHNARHQLSRCRCRCSRQSRRRFAAHFSFTTFSHLSFTHSSGSVVVGFVLQRQQLLAVKYDTRVES